jgi:oligoribonuclease
MKKVFLKDPIVWIDLEMTGLDLARDRIIEIAVVLTDGHLKNRVQGPNIVITCEKNIIGNLTRYIKYIMVMKMKFIT